MLEVRTYDYKPVNEEECRSEPLVAMPFEFWLCDWPILKVEHPIILRR